MYGSKMGPRGGTAIVLTLIKRAGLVANAFSIMKHRREKEDRERDEMREMRERERQGKVRRLDSQVFCCY